MDKQLLHLAEPTDYFKGAGNLQLPVPTHVLLFLRKEKSRLQQNALQNRSHHRFVLIFNLATKGTVHVDTNSIPFSPGQALLVLPYQFHHYSQLEKPELQWLFCSFELKRTDFLEPLRNRAVHVGAQTNDILGELLRQWHRPVSELRAWQLQSILLHLLVSLKADQQESKTRSLPNAENDLLWTVNRLMDEWRGRPVTVADLAKAMGWSTSRLRVLFKESAGIPLGSYLQNYRLNCAMELLRTTKMPIAAIAEEAGFGSPQAFSRVFKNETGKSPRTYRQEG